MSSEQIKKYTCPKCSKVSAIKSGLGYKCTECNFTWNTNLFPALISFLVGIIFLVAIFVFNNYSNTNTSENNPTKVIDNISSDHKNLTNKTIESTTENTNINNTSKQSTTQDNQNKEQRLKASNMILPQSTTDLEISDESDKTNNNELVSNELNNTNIVDDNNLNQSSEDNQWQISSSHDSTTDETIVIASVQSQNTYKDRWQDDRKADLMIRCKKNKTEVAINFGVTVACRGRSKILYSIDQDKDNSEAWFASTNCVGLFAPQPIHLMKKLKNHKQLQVTFKPYMNDETTITFPLGEDFDKAYLLVSNSCKW